MSRVLANRSARVGFSSCGRAGQLCERFPIHAGCVGGSGSYESSADGAPRRRRTRPRDRGPTLVELASGISLVDEHERNAFDRIDRPLRITRRALFICSLETAALGGTTTSNVRDVAVLSPFTGVGVRVVSPPVRRYTAAASYRLHSGIRIESSVEYYQFSDFANDVAIHVGLAASF